MKRNINTRGKQGGFITGMLIIGIALMAVVVAAIAMASNSSSTDVSKQKTKTTAAVGMKKVADYVEAFQIKVAEDGTAAAEALTPPTMPKGFQDAEAEGGITAPTYVGGKLIVTGVVADVCTQINSTLGLTTAPADAAAVTADLREACTADGSYVRVVKG